MLLEQGKQHRKRWARGGGVGDSRVAAEVGAVRKTATRQPVLSIPVTSQATSCAGVHATMLMAHVK